MKENNDGNDINVGSMGNSIKETIKIIERKIKEAEHYSDITGLYLTLDKELCNAFINILSDYKRVLKENEELKNKIVEKEFEIIGTEEYTKASMGEIIEQYYTANEECIPVQKVKDKIEEIKGNMLYLSQFSDWNKEEYTNEDVINNCIEVLQELLGGEQ